MRIERSQTRPTELPPQTEIAAPVAKPAAEVDQVHGLLRVGDDFAAAGPAGGPGGPDFAGDPGDPVLPDAPPAPPEVVNLPDPELRTKHAGSISFKPFDGPLFANGVSPTDVAQGSIGDCFLMGSMAAVAHTDPDRIQKMITDNGNGTYTVTFHERDYGSRFKPVSVTVDGDLPVSASGKPLYAKSLDAKEDKMEMWVSVLEKAYAEWKGGYDDIGEGGSITKALESLTGRESRYTSSAAVDDSRMFYRLRAAVTNGHPTAAITFGESQADLYKGSGIYAWHTYTVMGVEEENGARFIQLRNPWGSSEPGNDGKDDGIFRLPLADFRKYYEGVVINDG